MKEEVKKEREIYAIGRPSLDTLTPNERKVFFSTLLQCVRESEVSRYNVILPFLIEFIFAL